VDHPYWREHESAHVAVPALCEHINFLNAKKPTMPMQVRDNKKIKLEDKEICDHVNKDDLSNREFVRIHAVQQNFTDIDFSKCIFSSCYFRNCNFTRCDFTGTSFRDSSFRGAQFEECDFKYATWDRTFLDERFLDTCLPSEENLARDLVRSLRTNFAQIGNYVAVNKAASIEVSLTGDHLYKAAYSRQSYYRAKYKGVARFWLAMRHLQWKFLDLLWGNGESIYRVVVAGSVVVFLVAACYLFSTRGDSFFNALVETIAHLWGTQWLAAMPVYYAVPLTMLRYVFLGLFMAILIKRLSRR
jgi:uncharacterized protein YjbI with pentapeptide repeats